MAKQQQNNNKKSRLVWKQTLFVTVYFEKIKFLAFFSDKEKIALEKHLVKCRKGQFCKTDELQFWSKFLQRRNTKKSDKHVER
jgi:hypothetical protein